jgi:hypothetical protein
VTPVVYSWPESQRDRPRIRPGCVVAKARRVLRFAFITTVIFINAATASAQSSEPAREPRSGAVLDLCVLGTESDGTSSVRQRALVFGPAGFERLDQDPTLAQTEAARHAREAFIAGLPLDRMAQVVTTIAPDPMWLSRERLSIAELSKHVLESNTLAIVGGADRGAQERALAAYSAACADWVIVPVIDSASWSWSWFDPPTKKLSLLHDAPLAAPDGSNPLMRGDAMLLPDITFAGRVGAFHREGDSFVRVAVVSGGSAHDVGMPDYPPADWGTGAPEFLSAIPDASCAIGAPRDGAPGLRCNGILDGDYISKGKNEFSLDVCTARNLNNPEVWIACITRLEAEKVAGGAQRKLRKVRGINLFDELRQHDGRPAIRLGRHEGVKVGYAFYVPDEHGGIGSYFKVTEAGAGGLDGHYDPSILRNRFGATPIGARVYEYPQSNLYLAPRLEGGLLAGMSAPTTMTTGPLAGQTVAFPTWAAGVALGAAWDFSGTVGSPEWRAMAEIHALASATSSARVGLLLVDWPSIEKGVYVGPRLKAFASLAFAWGWVWASANESASASIGGGSATFSFGGDYSRGRMIGASGTLGLEYMINPERLLRVDVSWRAHGAVELSASKAMQELALRGDHYNALLLRIGLELGR